MVQPGTSLDVLPPEEPEETEHGGCGSCGSGDAAERCGNGLEKIYPTTAVRFGYMGSIGEFTHAPDLKFTCGAKVVVQTRRGIELGEQVSLTCTGCDKSVTRDQMKAWVKNCGPDSYHFEAGRILREATAADLAEWARIQGSCRERRDFCRVAAKQHGLAMKVVACESPFGGERILYYFTAEERIDFRALVKDLAKEYRTRIEMRQIGARDEARLLADYETCGREVCCKVFLKTLRPISMRMAKLQKATLDPSQVSGRCGRLKCCLRYEHVSYEELNKLLPRNGIRIRTPHGDGVIVSRQILTQIVQIRMDDGERVSVVIEDILETNVKPPEPGAAPVKPPPRDRRSQAAKPTPQAPSSAPTGGEQAAKPNRPPQSNRPPARKRPARQAREGESKDKPASQAEQPEKRRRRRSRRRSKRRPSGEGGGNSGDQGGSGGGGNSGDQGGSGGGGGDTGSPPSSSS